MSAEWVHVIVAVAGVIVGGLITTAIRIWRGGYVVGKTEGGIRSEFQKSLAEAINQSEEHFEQKVETLVKHFTDTFSALRQKINDVELNTERNFLSKGDFDKFHKEYREDMRDLKSSIANISRGT